MRTFSEIVGSASSATAVSYPMSFATLTNNNTQANVNLGATLANNEQRYLLERFFDNERTYTTLTIGAEDLETTTDPLEGDTSATLTAVWPNITCQQLVVFPSSEQRTVFFTQGSATIRWQTALTEDCTDTTLSTIGVQSYPIPPQASKIKNDTITVGQLVYTPAPVQSIQEWTMLNALPYTSDIPNYFYIYNNQVNFFPIPSSSGNIITFNYQARVPDMSIQDYTTGTLSSIAVGDTQITGVGTTWSSVAPTGVDLTFLNLYLKITPPNGDGIWYPIQRFESDTSVTLVQPIQNAPASTASAYVIGQMPTIQEDFHDLLVYGPLKVYFSTIVKDKDKYQLYTDLYDRKMKYMEGYLSTKSVNVDLGQQPIQSNPNLYLYYPPN
jgi:hypothetical protein